MLVVSPYRHISSTDIFVMAQGTRFLLHSGNVAAHAPVLYEQIEANGREERINDRTFRGITIETSSSLNTLETFISLFYPASMPNLKSSDGSSDPQLIISLYTLSANYGATILKRLLMAYI